jgi:hypothetical protein
MTAATRVLRIDRHAFASNASSFDTAWRTFGWTAGIAGERAGRLEEAVPWAKLAARAEQPALLRGTAEGVLAPENFDRLNFAFLPLDGRLGFAVWGAIGREPRAAEWRVLTHTLLFDPEAFDRVAGNPFALLRDAPLNRWFTEMVEREHFERPAELEAVELPLARTTRTDFEKARLRELKRLRDRLVATDMDAATLERRLATVYEALAHALVTPGVPRVAIRSRGAPADSLFLRLAWLSLPLEDRAAVSFTTEQLRTEKPAAMLLLLPESEWGRFVPEGTRLLDFSSANGREPSPGRSHWARSLVLHPEAHGALARHALSRRWRILGRDDVARFDEVLRWREQSSGRITIEAARELLRIETTPRHGHARVRWRAAGHVIGVAVKGLKVDPRDRAAHAAMLLREVPSARAELVARAAIRTLARGDKADRQTAAFIRLHAARPDHAITPLSELMRLIDEEPLVDDVLEHRDGPAALLEGAYALMLGGHAAGDVLAARAIARFGDPAEPVRLTLATAPAADPRAARAARVVLDHLLAGVARPTDLETVIRAIHPEWLTRGDVLGDLTTKVESLGETAATAPAAAGLAGRLLRTALDVGTGALSIGEREAMLRLAWLELSNTGSSTLERYGLDRPGAALPVLIQLLVSTPPLPLFLRLRALLLHTTAPDAAARPELERWKHDIERDCPALHARIWGWRGGGPAMVIANSR